MIIAEYEFIDVDDSKIHPGKQLTCLKLFNMAHTAPVLLPLHPTEGHIRQGMGFTTATESHIRFHSRKQSQIACYQCFSLIFKTFLKPTSSTTTVHRSVTKSVLQNPPLAYAFAVGLRKRQCVQSSTSHDLVIGVHHPSMSERTLWRKSQWQAVTLCNSTSS